MCQFILRHCIIFLFSSLPLFGAGAEEIKLFDSWGKETPPKEKEQPLTFVGLLTQKGKSEACNVVHVSPNQSFTSGSCPIKGAKVSELTVTYFDRSGKRAFFQPLAVELFSKQNLQLAFIQVPELHDKNWLTSGFIPPKDESWFGGFKPKWELVRIWGYSKAGETSFQFQANTCKAARKTPYLKHVKIESDKDEKLIEEIPLFPESHPLKNQLVIEDCVRPLDASVPGGLITLAKDFSFKLGLLGAEQFQPLPDRTTASTPDDGATLLFRLIGADELEHPLPKEFSVFTVPYASPLFIQ